MRKRQKLILTSIAAGLIAASSPALGAPDIAYVSKSSSDRGALKRIDPRSEDITHVFALGKPGDPLFGRGHDPVWSHDRRRIAYADRYRTWVVRANGNARDSLTGGSQWGDEEPSWAPNDEKLAVEREPDESVDLWVYSIDGSVRRRLEFVAADPEWSPTAREIAFEDFLSISRVDPMGNHKKVLFEARRARDGVRLVRETEDVIWSPDGRYLALVAEHSKRQYEPGNREIWTVRRDGRKKLRLTRTPHDVDDFDPAWSPDGEWILFVRRTRGIQHIWRMRPDGSEQMQLTYGNYDNHSPAWSPSSSRIAFVSNRDGDPEIYVMDANGAGERQLTDNDKRDAEPAWATGSGSGP